MRSNAANNLPFNDLGRAGPGRAFPSTEFSFHGCVFSSLGTAFLPSRPYAWDRIFSLDRAFRLQHTAKRLKPATLSVLCRDASDWGLLEEEFRYVEQFFRHDLRNLNWTGHGPRRLHEGHGDRLSRRELLSEWPPFRTSV